jgi:hypothetical protein
MIRASWIADLPIDNTRLSLFQSPRSPIWGDGVKKSFILLQCPVNEIVMLLFFVRIAPDLIGNVKLRPQEALDQESKPQRIAYTHSNRRTRIVSKRTQSRHPGTRSGAKENTDGKPAGSFPGTL